MRWVGLVGTGHVSGLAPPPVTRKASTRAQLECREVWYSMNVVDLETCAVNPEPAECECERVLLC